MVATSLIKNVSGLVLSLKRWVFQHRVETLILLLVLLIGAYLRLYRIGEYMTFLGDEGRDAIIVRRLLVNFDPILVGPGTSIGNMYLGPLYYYLIAPALLLANFSPVGPSILVALIGVVTIFLIWHVARVWFGRATAIAVAVLYTLSPTVIIFSKSSWNPNIMPFFALLTVWCVWKIFHDKSYKWFFPLGFSFAFVLNSHYIGLLLLPVIIFFWYRGYKEARQKGGGKSYLSYTKYSVAIFALLMSPLVIFDGRHEFRNFKAMIDFVSHREGSFKGISDAFVNIWRVFENMFIRLPGVKHEILGRLIAIFALVSIVHVFLAKRLKFGLPLKLTLLWVLFGVVGLAFVEREIYDHYMGFLFPAAYLLLAGLVSELIGLKAVLPVVRKIFAVSVGLVCILLVIYSLLNSPIKYAPNRQMARSEAVAAKILEESESKKFNLAVLAERNYEDGYRYFLEVAGATILHADIWDKSTIADNLFVVCEKPKEECQPTTDAKAEVANFGPSMVEREWNVGGIYLFKLKHKNL